MSRLLSTSASFRSPFQSLINLRVCRACNVTFLQKRQCSDHAGFDHEGGHFKLHKQTQKLQDEVLNTQKEVSKQDSNLFLKNGQISVAFDEMRVFLNEFLIEVHRTHGKLANDNGRLDNMVKNYQSKLEESQERSQETIRELNAQIMEQSSKIDNLEDSNKKLDSTIHDQELEMAMRQEKITHVSTEISKLTDSELKLENEIKLLREQIGKIEIERTKAEKDVEIKDNALKRTEYDNKKLIKDNNDLNDELIEANVQINQLVMKSENASNTTLELEISREEIARLKKHRILLFFGVIALGFLVFDNYNNSKEKIIGGQDDDKDDDKDKHNDRDDKDGKITAPVEGSTVTDTVINQDEQAIDKEDGKEKDNLLTPLGVSIGLNLLAFLWLVVKPNSGG